MSHFESFVLGDVAAVGVDCLFILLDSCFAVCVHYDNPEETTYLLIDFFQVGTCCNYQGKLCSSLLTLRVVT